ncbi:MAG: hypothetical protein DIU61_001815 [Bacteroidota bacterium]|jgi:hypothetical protein|nr:MAG: hypothetical protein DIU61_00540 [Bacteroidota bacterium]
MSRKLIVAFMILVAQGSLAQGVDQERMNRDLRVAENVLVTLIQQKMEGNRMFFPLSITASYQAGVGVTFTLPADYTTPIALVFPARSYDVQSVSGGVVRRQLPAAQGEGDEWKLKDRQQLNLDSLRDLSNERIIEAARDFLADYGSLLSQLPSGEKVVITNRGDQPRAWVGSLVSAPSRMLLSVEASTDDINALRNARINRDEFVKRIKVTTAEVTGEVEPDLELLSTIFSRLYRPDLSKTFFVDGTIPYERMKNFGVVYYMRVFSANRTFNSTYDMPTVGLKDVNQQERDAKVKELYPKFESELKENILEYGRTLKSLGDQEQLVFNVALTQCYQCKIPSTLELSILGSDLKAYNEGKTDRQTALSKIVSKRGPDQ